MMNKKNLYGIYTVDDNTKHKLSIYQITTKINTALEAGLPWLQIRDKTTSSTYWPLWHTIALKAYASGTQLIINDHIDLLLSILNQYPHNKYPNQKKPGLHIGQSDTQLTHARTCLHHSITIGVTCHNSLELAETAVQNGASYVAFGRFFPSSTKPLAPPALKNTLTTFKNQYTTPIAVIGGITAQTLHQLTPTPATLFALSAGLWAQPSIAKTIQQLNTILTSTERD